MRPLPDAVGAASLQRHLTDNAHAYTREELVSRWSRPSLDRALRDHVVVRVLPNVYLASAHRRHPTAMGDALNLWAPRGLVTGELAVILYGADLPVPSCADIVVANGDRMETWPWVRVRQTGHPRASGLPGGVRCVAPARAVLDAWRYATPVRRDDIVYAALWARVCNWRQLARELEQAPRVSDRRRLERLLAWFAAGATSPLEVRARRDVFAGPQFRDFEWQASVQLQTRSVRVDMLHRGAMVVVELDGDTYHATREARDADRERQTSLAAAGLVVIRFGWRDIVGRPQWCRRQLLVVVSCRLPRSGRR